MDVIKSMIFKFDDCCINKIMKFLTNDKNDDIFNMIAKFLFEYYMFNQSYSATVYGMEVCIINVEADVSDGLPMYSLVGYLSTQAKEAKERVRISMKNSGYKIPVKRITINLSPADIRKDGTAFDLPMAVAILTALGWINSPLKKILMIGELSLDGKVNPVTGVLPIVYAALKQGFTKCIVPYANRKEGAVVQGIDVIGVKSLQEAVEYLNGRKNILPETIYWEETKTAEKHEDIDFSDVKGQEIMKRAIEVAVSGMHNMLMIGAPGAGKTMLAKRVPTIMPKLTFEESMELSKIYSIAGLLNEEHAFVIRRPFRSPHHSVTAAALIGGGVIPKPGEITLADKGVLFLDELTEFNHNTLELLRQPLEDRKVNIARLNASCSYPTGFMLISAMNPCKCGYYPDRNRCNCSLTQVKKYLNKISQPFLDRMDICVEAVEVKYKDLEKKSGGESSENIRKRVEETRKIQRDRYCNENIYFNAELSEKQIKEFCLLGKEEKKFLEQIFLKMNLSARAYDRILKVARTIADMEKSESIHIKHLSESVCYRSLDKKYWGIEMC